MIGRLWDDAECREADPSQFDATSYSLSARVTIANYCGPCRVVALCRQVVGESPGFSGIAGGIVWVGKGPARRGPRL